MTDAQLLGRFVDSSDQQAFAELVERHVHWVNSMARRMVRDDSLAADATQAVFILLSRKASSLRHKPVIATWLFNVTHYAALKVIRMEARRRKHERIAAAMRAQTAPITDPSQWDDLAPMLDDLVRRLRTSDREAILLRFYEQKSFPEIGQALDISEEAARKRVSRAVDQLRASFARKGIAVGSAALAASIAANLTHPAAAAVLAAATSANTLGAASTLSPIIKGGSSMLFWTILKPIVAGVASLLLGAAAVAIVMQVNGQRTDAVAAKPSAPASAPASAPSPSADSAGIYAGQVLDSDDKPLADAQVYLIIPDTTVSRPLATAKSDAQGQFRLSAPKSQLAGHAVLPQLLAVAPGFAPTGVRVLGNLPASIKLRRPSEAHARLLDPLGKPVAGVRAVVTTIIDSRLRWTVDIPSELRTSFSATANDNGELVLAGMPQDTRIRLGILDDRFITPSPLLGAAVSAARGGRVGTADPGEIWVGPSPQTQAGEIALAFAGAIAGRVVHADGRGAAGIGVRARLPDARGRASLAEYIATTDAQGNYRLTRLSPVAYDVSVAVGGDVGASLNAPARRNISVSTGPDTRAPDLVLARGGIIKGRVIMQATGKPVAGASVLVNGPAAPGLSMPGTSQADQMATTNADGTYHMHVPPGTQQIFVSAPGNSTMYTLPAQIDIADGQTATVPDLEMMQDTRPSVKGSVLDPDGKPVAGAIVNITQDIATPSAQETLVAVTDSQGIFNHPDLKVGMTRMRLRAALGQTLISDFVAVPDTDVPLTLKLHQRITPSTVRVHVTDAGGATLPNVRVYVMRAMGATRQGAAPARGGFAQAPGRATRGGASTFGGVFSASGEAMITGPDGVCIIDELYSDEPYWLQGRAEGFSDATAMQVDLQPGQQTEISLTMKRADSFIGGLVIDEQSNPLPGMEVMVMNGGAAGRRVTTDAIGRFRIDGLAADETMMITIRKPSDPASDAIQTIQPGSADIVLTYRPGARPTNSFPRGGRRG